MSEWITDRKPTAEDGIEGTVLAWHDGKCILAPYDYADYAGLPWMPITAPKPHVKPKRWTVRYNHGFGTWGIYEDIVFRVALNGLDRNDDKHREAAERIAAIYEEVMP